MVRSLTTARTLRLALAILPLVALALTVGVPAGEAAIANVRTGSVVSSSGNSLAVTMSSGSTAGDLLVATISSDNGSATFSGPSGWVQGPNVGVGGNSGRAEIWYYANNPGGISSATFTTSGATLVAGQLSEWSGVATSSPLDASGTNTTTGATNITVSTSGAPTVTGGVGITSFDLAMGKSQNITFTPGSGWSNLGSNGSTSPTNAYTADYKLSVGTSTVSEQETANKAWDWAATIAVFKPAPSCSGGSLTLSAPSSASFSAVTLDGTDQTVTTTVQVTPDDETGSGSGWNVTGTSTTFNDGSGHTLSTSATSVTSASAAAGSPSCNLPTNSIGYPVTLPAGSSPPTAVKLYNAAAATGKGQTNVTLTFQLAVPANAHIGTYTSTWTFAIVSGP
jgi:hypothetical protein